MSCISTAPPLQLLKYPFVVVHVILTKLMGVLWVKEYFANVWKFIFTVILTPGALICQKIPKVKCVIFNTLWPAGFIFITGVNLQPLPPSPTQEQQQEPPADLKRSLEQFPLLIKCSRFYSYLFPAVFCWDGNISRHIIFICNKQIGNIHMQKGLNTTAVILSLCPHLANGTLEPLSQFENIPPCIQFRYAKGHQSDQPFFEQLK